MLPFNLVRVVQSPLASLIRSIHGSQPRLDRVAAPDPISHMRPIIYEDTTEALVPAYQRHPYSLTEFKDEGGILSGDCQLQYGLLRTQLDALHQDFWLDSNLRFNAAKKAILASLPDSAEQIDKEEALSDFHKQWLIQEKARTDQYTQEWRTKNMQLIKLALRVEIQAFSTRLSQILARTT